MADEDPRSPMSIGIGLAARVSTLGLEFAIPVFAGHYLDGHLGSYPVGLMTGMVVGFTVGMMHLLKIARDSSRPMP